MAAVMAIEIDHAIVERDGTRVVHDVSFSVALGEWFGLIGANGSGKTSLLRAVAGRLDLAGGACRIAGRECADDRLLRAQTIGFSLPPERLPDGMRAKEVLALLGNGDLDQVWHHLGDLRQALGLDAILDLWVGTFSAGMRQRLALACAFAGGQNHVILDEPFNWLDPVAVYDLRLALQARVKAGLTLITALHDLHTLLAACDNGLLLAEGREAVRLSPAMLAQGRGDAQGFEREMIEALRGV